MAERERLVMERLDFLRDKLKNSFGEMVKLRGLPFRPGAFPALDEYGATLAQATAAEDSALAEIAESRKAGKLEVFTGKL